MVHDMVRGKRPMTAALLLLGVATIVAAATAVVLLQHRAAAGAGSDNDGEAALRWVSRQSPTGRSAAVILQVGTDSLLLEYKDNGYPLTFWRNSYDLIGGNGEARERYVDVILRELSEEFSAAFAASLKPQLLSCERHYTYSDYVFALDDSLPIQTRIYFLSLSHAQAELGLQAKAQTGEAGR
eukprot:COSAG01_NODE_26922_length_699_cov_1.198333_1_plen_182_part_01